MKHLLLLMVRGPWPCLYLFALFMGAPAFQVRAQAVTDFARIDSLIQVLTTSYRWAELDSVGQAALRQGVDYPALRRRLGTAALASDRPAAAIGHYGRALHENPLDTAARYGLSVAYLEMNQPAPAAWVARNLAASMQQALRLRPFAALTRVEVEASGQYTSFERRGNAGFVRLGTSSRLSSRISLSLDASYFGQTVELPGSRRTGPVEYPIRQRLYHSLLGVQLTPRWRALVGYDYLTSDFSGLVTTPGHLGYLSLSYAQPFWTAQVGLFAGTLTDSARTQADVRLTIYPLGNLRLYGFGRVSTVRSGGRTYPNGVLGAGTRLRPRLWLEAYGGIGQVPVLAELDGTYVYNLLDPQRQRAGASLLILLPRDLSLRLSGTAEERRDAVVATRTFNMYSLTTVLAWTW